VADGFRSLLAPWIGGASSPPGAPAAQGGFRSLLAFWAGGATTGIVVTPEPETTVSGGGPDSSDDSPDNDQDSADGISPSYDAYVKRINEQRAAEWQQGISGKRVETSGHGQIASARADRLLSEIAVPSARVAALSGRVERATRPPPHPATIHDDEMLAMLAMVLVLTDD
jgi:hypothetical protein